MDRQSRASGSAFWPPTSARRCWPKRAALGIFKSALAQPRPLSELRKKYFMRSRDPRSDVVRAAPELRSLIEFRRLNFMDANFGISDRFDIIFCRNVIIYFDRPTQERLLEKLTGYLAPRRLFLRGPFGILARNEFAADARRAVGLPEKDMTDCVPILPDLNLQPGELYLARGPAILRTILGSCVGVTFWSRRLRAGALCHGVLPRCPPQLSLAESCRYVDFSIRYLARQFDELGARRRDLEVKVFGGADVLPIDRAAGGRTDRWAHRIARRRWRFWWTKDSRCRHPIWAGEGAGEFISTPAQAEGAATSPGALEGAVLKPMEKRKIRVLIVDDSAVVRQTLRDILSRDPAIEVMNTASDPFVAAERMRAGRHPT